MEIVTKAKELKGKVNDESLKELDFFLINTNLSEKDKTKLVQIIEKIVNS